MAPRFFSPMPNRFWKSCGCMRGSPCWQGAPARALIVGEQEVEDNPGLTLALYLPAQSRTLRGLSFHAGNKSKRRMAQHFWRSETSVEPGQTNGWLAFIDPFHLDSETWLRTWNESYAPLPVLGGLASGDFFRATHPGVFEWRRVRNRRRRDFPSAGDVKLAGVTSQGCTPIGRDLDPHQSRAEHHFTRSATGQLTKCSPKHSMRLSPEEQKAARGNLFIGLVVNEYLDEFHRGDFSDPQTCLGPTRAQAASPSARLPRQGQTMQFSAPAPPLRRPKT